MSDQLPGYGAPAFPPTPPPTPPPLMPPPPLTPPGFVAGPPPSPILPPSDYVTAPTAEPRVIVTQRRGPGALGTIVIAALTAAIVGGFAGLAGYMIGRGVDDTASVPQVTSVVLPQTTTNSAERPAGSVSNIAEATLPAVVSIVGESDAGSGSGSGFIVRPDGYIITNKHVTDLVNGGGTLTVVLNDGTRYTGEVVGGNPSYDIAVVKIPASNLPTVTLGDSSAVRVGDSAIAIGAPLGLEGTVTSGIVSALNRVVTPGDGTAEDTSFINAIQTDAAISPGNSGGPLLDSTGSVIGVNAAMQSPVIGQTGEAANVGLGFAIPINSAKRIAEELISTGRSRTTLMGVGLDPKHTGPGAKILSVTAGGPADAAGIKKGDVVTKVNGRSIDDDTELVVEIRNHAPGDKVEITYTRDGQDRTTSLVLGDDSKG